MEDSYVINKTILEAIKKGYKSEHSSSEDFFIDVNNGKWIMSDGYVLGSTWDVILSPEFAKILWEENYQEVLKELVVREEEERIIFLRNLLPNEESTFIDEQDLDDIKLSSSSTLMQMIIESNEHLKSTSISIFRAVCEEQYNSLNIIVNKNSITELVYDDFLKLNWYNKMNDGALNNYLIDNNKKSFTICPECGSSEFNHEESCSIVYKSEFLDDQEGDGC
jgi:hypothetical protein